MDQQKQPPPIVPQPGFRSGAVARIARMPVSTLRIWEQRYRAVRPATGPSGHRLYSATDVERVLLLRRLTEQGHAISAMAALDAEQLRQVASTQALAEVREPVVGSSRTAALQVIVVGRALALRLRSPAMVRQLKSRWQVTAVFESLADAARASSGGTVDWLLWQAPGLPIGALPELQAARQAWGTPRVAVVYRFAGAAARKAFTAAGATVVREPADDEALGAWMAALEAASAPGTEIPNDPFVPRERQAASPPMPDEPMKPRRFDDAALTTFASLSTTIACECPRHVAELLMQISNFEAYSADCAQRTPADAKLHAYLQRVAGTSRALFEAALERMAREEGLTLP